MSRLRLDIQGLRAIAVGSVVLYHLRPGWLSGGFVGVDIFFVISGFLITGTLFSEATHHGTVRLGLFWGRRIRRLMPAATVVIVATVIAASQILPLSQWPSLATQAVASAVSVQNWVLAAGSVDYLHATALPSPFQHFWSLSVEEQFYILWPLAIVLVLVAARRMRRNGASALKGAVLVLAAVSLVFSIAYSPTHAGVAFFSTFTRAWELLLGASVAIWLPHLALPRRWASAALLGGLLALALSLILIDGSTTWPGYAALLPTVGTALIIVAGPSSGPAVVRRALQWRPVTYIGDISYSLYLWHWPIIVLVTAALGAPALPIGWAVAVGIASLVLSALSKRYIEDVFRAPRPRPSTETPPLLVRMRRHPFTLGVGLVAASSLAAGALYGSLIRIEERQKELAAVNFPGGRILDPTFDRSGFPNEPTAPIPNIMTLQDVERQLRVPCLQMVAETEVSTCTAGDVHGATTVMIAGDSHANMWLPAIDAIARQRHWRVVVAGKQSCPLVSVAMDETRPQGPVYAECALWNQQIPSLVAAIHPAFVLTSAAFYTYGTAKEGDASYDAHMAEAYAAQYSAIEALGVPVVAVAEVPLFTGFSAPDCLSRPRSTVDGCSAAMSKARVLRTSRIALAAQLDPRVRLIDVNDLLCTDDGCASAIGNVITYRDDNHLTPPFVESITWRIRQELDRLLPELGTITAQDATPGPGAGD